MLSLSAEHVLLVEHFLFLFTKLTNYQTRLLKAMKEVKALDVSKNGRIDESEFKRLCDPVVMAAAKLKLKVDGMWEELFRSGKIEIERIECWDFILRDEELAVLMGDSDGERGKS